MEIGAIENNNNCKINFIFSLVDNVWENIYVQRENKRIIVYEMFVIRTIKVRHFRSSSGSLIKIQKAGFWLKLCSALSLNCNQVLDFGIKYDQWDCGFL